MHVYCKEGNGVKWSGWKASHCFLFTIKIIPCWDYFCFKKNLKTYVSSLMFSHNYWIFSTLEPRMLTHTSSYLWYFGLSPHLTTFSSWSCKNEYAESNTETLVCLDSSVQFSCSVVSDSLRPHELQRARLPCPSPPPRVHPNPCPSSQWCHPVISSCVVPFFSCPQSLPASGSFPMSQLFTSGGQSIRVLASTSVLPMNTQDRSPLGWTG